MVTNTSSLRAMALLCIMLLPTIVVSSNMKPDEKSVTEIETSHLRKRLAVPEDRQLRPGRGSTEAARIRPVTPTFPPTFPPTPNPTPPVIIGVSPIKDVIVANPTPNPTSPDIVGVSPIKEEILMPSTPPPTMNPTYPPTPSPPPPPKVITLGDSYSSGIGIHRDGDQYDVEFGGNPTLNGVTYDFTANSEHACWMETDTTPGPMYAGQEGLESVFYGCGGAQIVHINSQLDYLLAKFPSDAQHNFQGSTILLTAGGNDIETVGGMSWPELLIECILETSIFSGCHDESSNQIANFPAIQTDLTSLFNRLANVASGAKIRVLGYPKMMQRDPTCWSVTGVSSNEADWIDAQCVSLNNRVQNAVYAAKLSHPTVDIEFVNVYTYLTVGACGNGPTNRHVHDKRLHSYFPYATSNSSFHPSQLGYNKYFEALVNSL